MAVINPEILIWARETAGLSLDEAARGIGLNAAYGKSGAERLAELEAGSNEPTNVQLTAMAKRYRRPLLVFYLDKPPKQGDRGQDFRKTPDAGNQELEPVLDALIRDIFARQSLVRNALEDDDAPHLAFVGSARMADGEQKIAQSIVDVIGFDLAKYRSYQEDSEAFRYVRQRLEASGIFVLLMNNLGSHHTDIPVATFRGFAIADRIAPFIVINGKDAKAALSFTALHEAAHIWLGNSGVSGEVVNTGIERFCNTIASLILLSQKDLLEFKIAADARFEKTAEAISRFADQLNVSRSLVAYRLYQAQRISDVQWTELRNHFRSEWDIAQDNQKKARTESEGGPSFYVTRKASLGKAMLDTTSRSLLEGYVTPTKAAAILGVKPMQVQRLLFGN